jgi:general secretion pathway protein G
VRRISPRLRRISLVLGGLALVSMVGIAALMIALNVIVTKPKVDRFRARDIRHSGEMWRQAHPGASTCPTPELLHAQGAVEERVGLVDRWGSPFRIVCSANETIVISPGPDRREGTQDDIVVPDGATLP